MTTPGKTTPIQTYRFRLKDKHSSALKRKARAVNYVWNFCNETQRHAAKWGRKWLSAYELGHLTAGCSAELGLLADTIEQIGKQYVRSRRQHRRPWLRFRGRKSLGWVPFRDGNIRLDGQAFIYHGIRYEPMHWRAFPDGAKILAGSFSQDARGRWYINCPVEVLPREAAPPVPVGVDLGLKAVATLSTGEAIGNPRHLARLAEKLGKAHRANKKRLATTTYARIKNARKDFLHKLSAQIAKNHNLIVVGDVSSSKLSQTRMAKSVLDAGWHSFKQMLSYKAIRHGGRYVEVNEAWTSQSCSSCGAIPPERPKGIAGLGIREWTCGDCGSVHDRDVNAARNILRLGQQSLAEGAAFSRAANHPSTRSAE